MAMTSQSAKGLILTSAIVTGGSTVAAKMLPDTLGGQGELPSPRILIGTAVAFTALSMLAGPAPGLAGAWALLIMTIAGLRNAAPILERFLGQPIPMKGKKP